MQRVGCNAGLAIIALALVASACGPLGGESEDIDDLSNRSLKVTFNTAASGGLMVDFDYDDQSQCSVLDGDAFARLNGESVPLFRGQYQYFPPQGDDGGFDCTHPSVTLGQLPADLPPPWTVQIGDSSQTVSVTFGPGTPNEFDIGPTTGVTLTSSLDTLDVPIERQGSDTTVAYAEATFTASDGQSTVRQGYVYQPYIRFLDPVAPGWPSGPVTAQIDVSYYPADALLGCQNANCSVAVDPADCYALPAPACSSLSAVVVTADVTVSLACASTNGICS